MPHRLREALHSPRARVCALLLAALCVVYPNVIFGGRSLVASDNLNPMRPPLSEDSYGPGFVPHDVWAVRGLHLYAGFYDPGAAWWIWEPGAHYFRRAALTRGQMPFWDPYVGAGAPAMANVNATHFFPPYLLVVLLGSGSLVRNAYALGLLFGAGFCTYLFLRRHELSEAGSAFGGLAFMLSGVLNQSIISLGGQTAACTPFALLVTRWFLDRPSAHRLAALAAAYAGVALSSSPPILVLLFGFTGLFALVAVARESPAAPARSRLGLLARYAAGAALALGLVAFYYLPAARLIAISSHAAQLYSAAARMVFPPVTLLQLLSPDLLGGSAIYTGQAVRDPVPWRMHAVGVTTILAALLAGRGPGSRRNGLALLALLVALAMAGKVVGLPPMQWASDLPVVRSLHFAVYSSFLLHLLIALLAGIGADRLWRGELGRRQAHLAFGAMAAALVALLWAALGLGLSLPWRPALLNWAGRYALLWLFAVALGLAAARAAGAPADARRLGRAGALFVVVALAEAVLCLSFPRQKRVDVWLHPPPHVRALQRLADGRRYADVWAVPANTNSAFGLFGLDSLMSFNSDRMIDLYRRYFRTFPEHFLREMERLPPEPVLDRAGVGWLVVRRQFGEWLEEAGRRGYAKSYEDDWAAIFRRASGLRYMVTPSYRVLSPSQALDEIARASSREVLLEEAPGFPARPFDDAASVELKEFRENALTLTVDSPGPALVYCAESHWPGWEATVDGRPARILAANYAFRAVEVPAGHSTVTLRYVPPGFRSGAALSALSLAVCAALLWIGRTRRVSRPRGSSDRPEPPEPAVGIPGQAGSDTQA